MSQRRLAIREELIHHLYEYHLDICDVAFVRKPPADGGTDGYGGDQCSNHEGQTRAHSSVLSAFSSVLKENLKSMFKSSHGVFIIYVDLDVSVEGMRTFVDCLYGKSIDKSMDRNIISDALKMASFYQVPIFIFEELLSSKTVYLCLEESLKRNEEEAKNLLESCKEMLQTNIAIYEDESLFQDLNLNLFKWIAALDELPVQNLSDYLIDFAVNQNSVEILAEARLNAKKCDSRVTEVLKIEKLGQYGPSEKFSIRYKNESVNDVLLRASTYSCDKFQTQNACLEVQQNSDLESSTLEMTSLLAEYDVKPGDTVFLKVKKQVEIVTIDGTRKTTFVDLNAKRIRDLKVQISDLLGTEEINLIRLMKDREILDDMKTLEVLFREKDEKVLTASIRGDPIDANTVVVGFGEDNVADWPAVVITANSFLSGSEPVKALSRSGGGWHSNLNNRSTLTRDPNNRSSMTRDQHWWQCKFQFPIVIGSFRFGGSWTRNGKHHVTQFKIEASMDEENWTTLVSEAGIREWTLGEAKQFTCQNVRAFKFYRFASLESTDDASVMLLSGVCFSESLF